MLILAIETESNRLKKEPTLYALTGPTAVGKTDLSIEWALRYDAEIVSCDSLLFYRGMEIGTAKPSKEALRKVKHHCIDLVPVSEQFSVDRYLTIAQSVVEAIHARGKRVLITGGSGFYLKGFFAPVVDSIVIPKRIQDEVSELYEAEGLHGVVAKLQSVAPDDYDLIDLKNSRRVIPALKRCMTTGLGINALKEQAENAPFPFKNYQTRSVLLSRAPERLKARIQQRTSMMLEAGLIDEVESLLSEGMESNPSAATSIGYREVISFLRNEINREELESLISLNTWKLVKKQLKWFKHQMQFDRVIDLDHETADPETLFDGR